MIITILVTTFLLMSAICTTVLIAACVVAKRSEAVIDSSSLFVQADEPARALARPVALDHQTAHTATKSQFGKTVLGGNS